MTKALGLIVSAAALLVVPQTAFAYTHCMGTISELAVYKDGKVIVSSGFGTIVVCNVTTTYTMAAPNDTTPISPDTCRAWYSSMLATQLANKELDIVINDTAGTGCNTGLVNSGGALLKTLVYYRFFTN